MNLNLDTVKAEAEEYLNQNGFLVFRGFSRGLDDVPEVDWDTVHYPDFRMFLDVAKKLNVKLVVMHHREFDSEIVDAAIDQLSTAGFEFEEQTQIETRLRELSMYDGFTCQLELSYDYEGILYLFELRTPWYTELTHLLDDIDSVGDDDDDEEDEESYGGYYSRN
jgi:hypothetical protein